MARPLQGFNPYRTHGLGLDLSGTHHRAELQEVSWGGVTFGVLANIVAFIINRFTRDGITPSMAKRLEQAGMMSFQEREKFGRVCLP